MSYKLSLLDHSTIVVSPSQLETLRTCPRQWLYRYLHRRVEREVDPAKAGGKALDEALNLRYRKCGSEPCSPEVEAEQLIMIRRVYEGVELPLEEFRTAARYMEVVQAYNKHWQAEPFRVLGVQVPFKLVLGEVEVPEQFWIRYCQSMGGHEFEALPINIHDDHRDTRLKCKYCRGSIWQSDHDKGYEVELDDVKVQVVVQGIIDLFGQLADHYMVMDTKTSKDNIGQSYDNSAQLKCYMWGLQELARLYPDKGFPKQVHCAQVNGIIVRPPYKNANRTAKENDKPRNSFERPFPSFYSAERLEEWRQDTLLWVEQALGWVARDHFPQNERHCHFHIDAQFRNFGTWGKSCPYATVCPLPKEQRELALASDTFMDYERGPLGMTEKGDVGVTT